MGLYSKTKPEYGGKINGEHRHQENATGAGTAQSEGKICCK